MIKPIKDWFKKGPTKSEKQEASLSDLTTRRDRAYADAEKYEAREHAILAEGKASTSSVTKRRLASQLAQIRKDIARHHTFVSMLNKQINIADTNNHNKTILEQGNMAVLPTTDELTEHAVSAEQIFETLTADADMVNDFDLSQDFAASSQEELDIMKEFDGPQEEEVVESELLTGNPTKERDQEEPEQEQEEPGAWPRRHPLKETS